MKKPYIGITGFMSSDEALHILNSVPFRAGPLVMIGVLASLKTIRGVKNKWPNRYPTMDRIAGIFPDHPLALNLIHYNTKEKDTLANQLIAMTEIGGVNLHGFQLNIAWPSLDVLHAYREAYPTKQIVLQIGEQAFEMVNHSPEQLASRVVEYDGLVEYVLLDPSGGYGKPFDSEHIRQYLLALREKNLDICFGFAGALSPATINLVEPLVKEFSRLSIDAEGCLRTPKDHLDLNLASEYLRRAFLIFD
ncbi:hypothetical protein KAR26_04055 [Candidatus Parcubacteria bacterium]|nr:hypothetical protein [Candidatus Parcubacteria bacterium]